MKKKNKAKKAVTRTKKASKKNYVQLDHPLLVHKVTRLRDQETRPAEFRNALRELSTLLAYEATRTLKLRKVPIETPLEPMNSAIVADRVLIVPILRAGSGMLEGALEILPFARVGHIGIYRDKFMHSTVEYYLRIPRDIKGDRVVLLDPLLATGDTAVAAINRLKEYHVGPIAYVCVLAAPEGLKKLQQMHPEVQVFCVQVERELSSRGYILPGLGDAGDRLFDTL